MVDAGINIRPAGADDAEALAGIRAAAVPYLVGTPAGMRARLADVDTRGRWVALVDGALAGYALTRAPDEGVARVTLVVHPDRVRRGVGSALLRVAEAGIRADGGIEALAVADGEPGREFAVAAGYDIGRESRFSGAPIAEAPPLPTAPPGVDLRPLAEVDPRAIWTLHELVIGDDPSGMSRSQPFDLWYAGDWTFPDHAADLGVAAFAGDEAVAFTHVFADRERGAVWSAMTGVRPDYRGRGLARLVKARAFQAARDAGMTHAYTANDAGNVAMLAVNTWLGYRPVARAWSVRAPVAW